MCRSHGSSNAFFSSGEPAVTPVELKAAIEELQWVEYAARTNRLRAGITASR